MMYLSALAGPVRGSRVIVGSRVGDTYPMRVRSLMRNWWPVGRVRSRQL